MAEKLIPLKKRIFRASLFFYSFFFLLLLKIFVRGALKQRAEIIPYNLIRVMPA